jgi:hemoglobin
MSITLGPDQTPFDLIGGEPAARRLAARFYDCMDEREPELARLHELDENGKVSERSRERFTRFLIEWLGGPALYSPKEGHPRLRMRHARVPVDVSMRDAWVRCMEAAMDDVRIEGPVRAFLTTRFFEVADFMRNR